MIRHLFRFCFSFCLLVPFLALGCGDDGAGESGDAGRTADSGGGGGFDAGPRRVPEALSYTPEGCGYEVRTPEVDEAQLSGDAIGDSPAPDHVHTSFAGPTDSSFAVSWQTDVGTTVSRVLYGTDRAAVEAATAGDEAAGVLEQAGHQVLFTTLTAGELRLHEVHVCGLEASTQYFYKAGGPGAWSEVYDVATGPTIGSAEPFRFGIAGDSRNDSVIWAQVQTRMRDSAADFQVFTGDAVQLGINQDDWDRFFGDAFEGTRSTDVMARIPFMPANGNHDALATNYLLQFALPQDESRAELGQGEQWYSFDYGNAHFAFLDSNVSGSQVEAQAEWLDADLGAVDRSVTPWVFVLHHHAQYSCSRNHGSQLDVREVLQPLIDRHEVDVVLNGHDHNYERSKPIRGFQDGTLEGEVVTEGGTLYVVTGGAGAPLYGIDSDCYHTEVAEETNHYAVADVDGNTLTVEVFRLDGTLLDSFELTK